LKEQLVIDFLKFKGSTHYRCHVNEKECHRLKENIHYIYRYDTEFISWIYFNHKRNQIIFYLYDVDLDYKRTKWYVWIWRT
jgi:hypothetical protein